MYRVLLVDDEEMLLDSLEIILSLNDMEIVGKAHDGRECLELLRTVTCDIALVDLNMKGMGGIELIGHLKKQYPQILLWVLFFFHSPPARFGLFGKFNEKSGEMGPKNLDLQIASIVLYYSSFANSKTES